MFPVPFLAPKALQIERLNGHRDSIKLPLMDGVFRIAAVVAGVCLVAVAPAEGHSVLRYRADLGPVVGAGESSEVPAGGEVVALFEPDESSGGPRLTYFIKLNGLDLDGARTPGLAADDVVAVRFRIGAPDAAGPHALNVFGRVDGEPREDDANLGFNPATGEVYGIWDVGDERFTGDAGVRLPVDSVAMADAVSELLAGKLVLEVTTKARPSGELRGQLLPEPSAVALKRLDGGGFQMTFNVFSPRIIRIEAGERIGEWEFVQDLVASSSVARTVDLDAAGRDRRFYRLSELILVHPKIVSHPTDQVVTAGGSVSFEVIAEGTPSPEYQWYHDGELVPDAIGSTLQLTNVQADDAGDYQVVAASFVGSVFSEAATLTVTP